MESTELVKLLVQSIVVGGAAWMGISAKLKWIHEEVRTAHKRIDDHLRVH